MFDCCTEHVFLGTHLYFIIKMVRKELDRRIRTLIESGVKQGHRSMFVVLGDKAQDQVSENLLKICTVSE